MSVNSDSGASQKIEPSPVQCQISPKCDEVAFAETSSEMGATGGEAFQRDFGWKARLNDTLGKVIDGKYELLELIGTGGMGAVFKANNKVTNAPVAVKILHPHLAVEGPSLKRFQLEAKAASRIDHPNSVSVHDFGVWNKHAYLVMDYLEGKSLAHLIRQNGKLKPDFALPIFVQACAGLIAAHKLGIFHRDVKPSNFVVMDALSGVTTKVCDFGLVKLKIQEGDTITGTGEVFGSPPYMSPEQCLGRTVDERSDMYSMGILMYEALTGFLPIKGGNPLDTMRMQVSTSPPEIDLREEDPRVAGKLAQIIKKTLAKDPEDRYESMEALKAALEKVDEEMKQRSFHRKNFAGRAPAPPRVRFIDRIRTDLPKQERESDESSGF
jgi:serine/threonine protein kinase